MIKKTNMILNERRKTEKCRKRLRLSYLIILILSLWLIRKYNDVGYLEIDKEMLEYEVVNKDSEIFKLKNQIDSLSKPKEEIVVKEPTPIRVRKITQDTTRQIPKVDIIKKETESDTL